MSAGRYPRRVARSRALALASVFASGLLALLALGAGCKGANSPSGECLSYACDADGAKAMMHATIDQSYTPSERAKAALDQVIEDAVKKMAAGDQGGGQGFTPESFELARGNLKKFLDEVPEGGQDALGPAAEELAKKGAKLCPLWPYC